MPGVAGRETEMPSICSKEETVTQHLTYRVVAREQTFLNSISPTAQPPIGEGKPEGADPTPHHRDPARNCAPPDGPTSAAMDRDATIGYLLLFTGFRKWRKGNRHAGLALRTEVVSIPQISQTTSYPEH